MLVCDKCGKKVDPAYLTVDDAPWVTVTAAALGGAGLAAGGAGLAVLGTAIGFPLAIPLVLIGIPLGKWLRGAVTDPKTLCPECAAELVAEAERAREAAERAKEAEAEGDAMGRFVARCLAAYGAGAPPPVPTTDIEHAALAAANQIIAKRAPAAPPPLT
jgi:hypothetical protein